MVEWGGDGGFRYGKWSTEHPQAGVPHCHLSVCPPSHIAILSSAHQAVRVQLVDRCPSLERIHLYRTLAHLNSIHHHHHRHHHSSAPLHQWRGRSRYPSELIYIAPACHIWLLARLHISTWVSGRAQTGGAGCVSDWTGWLRTARAPKCRGDWAGVSGSRKTAPREFYAHVRRHRRTSIGPETREGGGGKSNSTGSQARPANMCIAGDGTCAWIGGIG